MKKSFIMLTMLLMLGSSVFAGGGLDFGIGPKIGYQTSTLSYKKADIQSGFANHFTVGLFGRIGYKFFYVQPEVLYFRTSTLFNVDVNPTSTFLNIPTGADVNITMNSVNLQVPVLVGFKLFDTSLITLRVQGGPTANFVLNSQPLASYTTEDGVTTEITEETATNWFNTKNIAWGVQAGVGVDVLRRITLDVNYNFGLTKVFQKLDESGIGSEYFDFSKIEDTKQGLFMVTVGYKFL